MFLHCEHATDSTLATDSPLATDNTRPQSNIDAIHSWCAANLTLTKLKSSLKTFSLPTNAHNVKKHRVIKTF